jgi:MoaA/NifB/PqqE/SkfB family radical SAM enzyme
MSVARRAVKSGLDAVGLFRPAKRAYDAWRYAPAEKRSLPPGVSIELTNNCNLMCAKCPTYEASRGRGFMPRERFNSIMEDIGNASDTIHVGLSGGGEAIMHPEVIDLVGLAARTKNVSVIGLTTNALALDDTLSHRLLDAGLQRLKFSTDTTDPKTYLKYNRVDGFERAKQNIKNFVRIRNEGNYRCTVDFKVTLYKYDQKIVDDMKEYWRGYYDSIRFSGLHDWLGLRGHGKVDGFRSACSYLWSMTEILWNGQISLCCFDAMEGYINMGNVDTTPLSHYWQHNDKLKKIRQTQLDGDFSASPTCEKCTIRSYVINYEDVI